MFSTNAIFHCMLLLVEAVLYAGVEKMRYPAIIVHFDGGYIVFDGFWDNDNFSKLKARYQGFR